MQYTVVIFGASGDLTQRKLVPALYTLDRKGQLSEGTSIVGVSRSPFTDQQWRADLGESTAKQLGGTLDRTAWDRFANRVHYQAGDLAQPAAMESLARHLDELECNQPATRIYYLATSPTLYSTAIAQLGHAKLADQQRGPRRLVIEKPFGTDLASARRLNSELHEVFPEDQVYRIDHYLGKETVQNILVLRFANSIFEPLWNRGFIDHVQITVAEEVTIAQRAGYYDAAGILRDMFQNHLLQLMTFVAMEVPARFEPNLVRDEKVKVLESVRPLTGADLITDTLRAQYMGYPNEEGVAPGSTTATFAAVKLQIDNWRWKGVPFYLRSGKAMSCRTTQIVVQFREPPHLMFQSGTGGEMPSNRLVIQIQPAEGIQLHFQTKVPDAGMRVRQSHLDFSFRRAFNADLPDAYQRLLLDALSGDASLFARSDEVELAWQIVDPVVAAWEEEGPAAPPLLLYEPQGWGPEESAEWMRRQGREWFDVCPVLA
jgi:glucose-6-phosphate 1-dehydrogenase